MDGVFATVLGLVFRLLVERATDGNIRLGTSLVGLWEGVVLHHFDLQKSSSIITYAFRIAVDLFLTESIDRVLLVLLWTGLGVVLSDTAASIYVIDDRFSPPRSARTTPTHLSKRASHSRARHHADKYHRRSELFPHVHRGTVPTIKPHDPPGHTPSFPAHSSATGEADTHQGLSLPPNRLSECSSDLSRTEHDEFPNDLSGLSTLPQSQTLPPDSVDTRTRQSVLETTDTLETVVSADLGSTNVGAILATPDPHPLISALIQCNRIFDDPHGSPTHIMPPDLHVPINFSSDDPISGDLPVVRDHHDTLSVLPMTCTTEPLASPVVPIVLSDETLTCSPDCGKSVSESINIPPSALVAGRIPTIPESPTASICGSQTTLGDCESVISTGSHHFVISRADSFRKEAMAEERERDRLKVAMDTSFRRGRIREGILLEGEAEQADEKSKKLHDKAAHRYFHARNTCLQSHTIDVHYLRVHEAIGVTIKALRDTLLKGGGQLRVIVGRGLHSRHKAPVLKPAIIAEMKRRDIPYMIDPTNEGVLVIMLHD